jgi:hypothetical protein
MKPITPIAMTTSGMPIPIPILAPFVRPCGPGVGDGELVDVDVE